VENPFGYETNDIIFVRLRACSDLLWLLKTPHIQLLLLASNFTLRSQERSAASDSRSWRSLGAASPLSVEVARSGGKSERPGLGPVGRGALEERMFRSEER
jgi:hypothetical protein